MAKGRAYGRVNLIGEHTDYNGGWVLPTSIPQFTEVEVERRPDSVVSVHAGDDPHSGEERSKSYVLGAEIPLGEWIDYIQGGTKVLREGGHALQGFKAKISSNIPEGAGLSSSAALEVALLKALREEFDLSLTGMEIALAGQKIENDFVGARVGIMDQMACTMAKPGEALFLDTFTLRVQRVPIPESMEILVINSGISHRNVGGGYNTRRQECESACHLLGVETLRAVTSLTSLESLPQNLKKRARHVITENERVHLAVAALREDNGAKLGEIFKASHASMRDDYEISLPEIDTLVSLLHGAPAVFGARLTGGGFGGSVVAITLPGRGAEVAGKVIPAYAEATGERASILVPKMEARGR